MQAHLVFQVINQNIENFRWIESTETSVAEFLTRPSKLRADAAQMEINMITDIQQTLVEKQAVLEDINSRYDL